MLSLVTWQAGPCSLFVHKKSFIMALTDGGKCDELAYKFKRSHVPEKMPWPHSATIMISAIICRVNAICDVAKVYDVLICFMIQSVS